MKYVHSQTRQTEVKRLYSVMYVSTHIHTYVRTYKDMYSMMMLKLGFSKYTHNTIVTTNDE